jgi:hypothetical protein
LRRLAAKEAGPCSPTSLASSLSRESTSFLAGLLCLFEQVVLIASQASNTSGFDYSRLRQPSTTDPILDTLDSVILVTQQT